MLLLPLRNQLQAMIETAVAIDLAGSTYFSGLLPLRILVLVGQHRQWNKRRIVLVGEMPGHSKILSPSAWIGLSIKSM